MKSYELWLDESGSFDSEQQQKRPSFVGGVLIEKDTFSDDELTELVAADAAGGRASGHAMYMDRSEFHDIVLPALQSIVQAGGKLVYFINKEHLAIYANKDLYMRVLASGIIQILQYLGREGEFSIDITIAVRMDPTTHYQKHISERDYRRTLEQYLVEQWKSGSFDINVRSDINIAIMSARRERRLQLADYACNARYSLKGNRINHEMKEAVRSCFDEDYIFSVHVRTPENYIFSQLATGDAASALMELYTGHDQDRHAELFAKVCKRLKDVSFRLVRLQVGQFVSQVSAYVRSENDFERSEAVLKTILSEFFPALEQNSIDTELDEPRFRILWLLEDMYLREGDILHAQETLHDMAAVLHKMDNRAENLRFLYLFLDREALLHINRMEYDEAVETIGKSITCMESVRGVLESDNVLRTYLGGRSEMHSEWLGNAYCMKIYAEMFLQRQRPEMYEAIRKDTETALAQYDDAGALERNQQYRAHVEMEAGNYKEAAAWLFRTQQLDPSDDIIENCVSYLDRAMDEDYISRIYYLMYYVEVMTEAQLHGDAVLADSLRQGLGYQKDIQEEFLNLEEDDEVIPSDTGREHPVFEQFLWKTLGLAPGLYHPLEIVYWKYGTFLAATGNYMTALAFWQKAVEVCASNPDYAVMKVIGIAIRAEAFYWAVQAQDGSRLKKMRDDLLREIGNLANDPALSPNMKEWLASCRKAARELKTGSFEKDPAVARALYDVTRQIAY